MPADLRAEAVVIPPMTDDLNMRVRQAAANYAALSPLDRAIHDAAQRRSFVRGQTGRDPGPDVLVTENARLTAELKKSRADIKRLRKELKDAHMLLRWVVSKPKKPIRPPMPIGATQRPPL